MSESRKLICAYCGEVDPDHVCMEDDTEWEDVPAAAPPPGTPARASEEDFEIAEAVADRFAYDEYGFDEAKSMKRKALALSRVLAEAREAQRLRGRIERAEDVLHQISCVVAGAAWWAWVPRLAASYFALAPKEDAK